MSPASHGFSSHSYLFYIRVSVNVPCPPAQHSATGATAAMPRILAATAAKPRSKWDYNFTLLAVLDGGEYLLLEFESQ